MNQNTFPNMGRVRPQQPNHHVGGMQRNGGGTSTDIQTHIMTVITRQPPPPGWQQTYSPRQRAGIIHQMVTGLQILKPDMNLTQAIKVATGFEMQQFINSPDQESYNEAYRAKLAEITRTRQNQANMHQQQIQNPQQVQVGLTQQQIQAQAIMNSQNPFQQGFGMPQEQQLGQAVGVPMQQQLSQTPRPFLNGNPPEMQPPMQTGQPMQNVPRAGPQNRGQAQFTPQEGQQIQHIAVQIMARMTEQDRMNVRQRLSQVSAEQLQAMQASNIDPLTAFVRNQATQTFIAERNKRRQQAGQGISMPSNGSMPPQARPASQISLRGQQQPQSTPIMQPPDPTFGAGNLDQFVGQQQDALRLQAAGQDVVPASIGQGTPAHMRATPHQQPQGQFAPNRMQAPGSFQPQPQPQSPWNGMQNQQANMPQPASMPLQTPTSNFASVQGQTPQQQALQGQLGGLNSNRGQRTPQQNHNMPTLNQPMDPPNPVKNEITSQQTPKQGQRNGSDSQPAAGKNPQPNGGQQNPQGPAVWQAQWARLPPKLKQQLTNMPEENRKQFFMELQRKQQQQNQQKKAAAEAQAAQNSQPAAQAIAQGAATGTKVSQANNASVVPPVSTAGAQQGTNPFGRLNTMQPQGPQQHGPSDAIRPPPQKAMQFPMTDDQRQKMDSHHFPPAILNRNNVLGQLPESVKTWHQLKEYVMHNAQNLPPQLMQNVNGLQGIHMQQILNDQKRRQQQLQQHMNQAAQAHLQAGPGGPAPQAPMIAQQPGQPPVTQPAVPLNAAHGFVMPNLPPPTAAEMQHARATLPDRVKGISDTQLRQMIMHRRHEDPIKANQQRLNPAQQIQQRNQLLQAQRQQGQLPIAQPQPAQVPQAVRSQAQLSQQGPQHQPPQPQQASKQQAQTNWQGRQTQANRPGAQNVPPASQRGPKRNSSDDVIEVPDPKTAPQQGRPSNTRQAPTNGMPPMALEAYAKMSAEQKIEVGKRMHAQAAQRAQSGLIDQSAPGHAPAPPTNQSAGPNTGKDGRLNQLMNEVAQTTPTRPIIPMSPRTRSQMIERLKDKTGNLVQRIELSLPVFLNKVQDEKQAKELLRIRLLLLRQVQGPDFSVPVENFTMTLEELDRFKTYLHRYFTYMLNAFRPPPNQGSGATGQLPPGQPQQLNVANLQQQQAAINAARVATAQKSQVNNNYSNNKNNNTNKNNNNNASNTNSNNNKAPAAPTSSHAPLNPFGATSPQGVPQAYATQNALTRDQLKLPPGKKRKPNQGASGTPTAAHASDTPLSKASPPVKVVSPEAPRAPVVPSMMKCTVSGCETGKMGFATKEDLEKHRTEVHEPREPVIKDPHEAAAYAIEAMRFALNLDENGKSKPVAQESKAEKGILQAPSMKASASSQGQSSIKQEVATPMSRIPTQTGPSPSSNLLKTPQATANVKTPASEAKSASKDPATKASTAVKSPAAVAPDPWANSRVRPEWFREVFGGLGNLNRQVPDDILTGWMERNRVTPATSPSSDEPDKDTPHKSDISTNDNLNIKVGGTEFDGMWLDDVLHDNMEALDMGEMMDMDWETAFGSPDDEGEALGKGKRRRDPLEPSDEWLKAWAPDKYEEKKKNEAERKG